MKSNIFNYSKNTNNFWSKHLLQKSFVKREGYIKTRCSQDKVLLKLVLMFWIVIDMLQDYTLILCLIS